MSFITDPNTLPGAVASSRLSARPVSSQSAPGADLTDTYAPLQNQSFNGYSGPQSNWTNGTSTLLQRLTNIMDGEIRNISPGQNNGNQNNPSQPGTNRSQFGSIELGELSTANNISTPNAHNATNHESVTAQTSQIQNEHGSAYQSSSRNVVPSYAVEHRTSNAVANISGRNNEDLKWIEAIIMHRKITVAHLDSMIKLMGLTRSGVKKVKQQKIMDHAHVLFGNQLLEELKVLRQIVEKNVPDELVSSIVGNAAHGDHLQLYPGDPNRSMNGNRNRMINDTSNQNASGLFRYPLPRNPLGPLVLTFISSPFYKLLSPLGEPVIFMKPHMKRRIAKAFDFKVNKSMLDKNNVFLVCQEFHRDKVEKQPMYFPFYMEMELDGQQVNANTRGVRGIPGSAKPVDLTDLLKATESMKPGKKHVLKLTLTISDQGDKMSDKSFAFSLNYGLKASMEGLIEQIKSKPHITKEETANLAKENAVSTDEVDIISSEAVYSLKDKVMMTRIALPIRSKSCSHIDCFDAKTFIMLQNQAETWKCPVCNTIITWDSLAVDDFFSEIIDKTDPSVDSVLIKPDGTWQVDNVDEHTDNDESDSGDEWVAKIKSKRICTDASKSRNEPEVVELLSDSDDDPHASSSCNVNGSTASESQPSVNPSVSNSHRNNPQNSETSLTNQSQQLNVPEASRLQGLSSESQSSSTNMAHQQLLEQATQYPSAAPSVLSEIRTCSPVSKLNSFGSFSTSVSQLVQPQIRGIYSQQLPNITQNAEQQTTNSQNIYSNGPQNEKPLLDPQMDLRNALRAFKKAPNTLFGYSLRPNSPSPPHSAVSDNSPNQPITLNSDQITGHRNTETIINSGTKSFPKITGPSNPEHNEQMHYTAKTAKPNNSRLLVQAFRPFHNDCSPQHQYIRQVHPSNDNYGEEDVIDLTGEP